MRLKRLELSGFKSFVDPTRIELGRGITSVVGPNGSGKSNIVDAIRWVLGEHSARHLRGGVMDDLIFQGSESRSSVAVCSVELIFGVEKGALAPPYHELDEISIRRRLTRDGGSDAFINGKAVRIKDVIDIFLDTGISTRAYAIIEQGSIARMITSKPEERRQLLEEAAGVMKYRARRRETELKMNSTRQNLERVNDLLEEVRSQCRSLRQQASRAERFKSMQEQAEQLQRQCMGYKYRHLQRQLAKEEAVVHQAEQDYQRFCTEHGKLEKLLLEARATVQKHEEQVQQAQESLRKDEQHRSLLQQQAERLSGERRLLQERLTSLEQRVQESSARKAMLNQDLQEIEKKVASKNDATLKADLEQSRRQFDADQQRWRTARQQREAMLNEVAQLRGALQNIEKRRQQAIEMVERLQQRKHKLADEYQQAQTQYQASQNQLSELEQELSQAQQQLEQLEQAVEKAQQAFEVSRQLRQQAVEQRDTCEQEMRASRGNCEELKAKLSQQQDVGAEFREQLRQQGGVWLDEALNVAEGMEQAVAAALLGAEADVYLPQSLESLVGSAAAQWETEFASKPVALRLQQQLPATQIGTSLAQALKLDTDHSLYAMFASVSLVDSLAQLYVPASGCVVSRSGWRMDAQGWLVPPSRQNTARRLSMKRQLREIEKQLKQQTKDWEKAESDLRQSREEEQQTHQVLQQAQQAQIEAKNQTHDLTGRLARTKTAVDSMKSRLQHTHQDLQALEADITHWQQQQAEASDADVSQLNESEARLQKQTEDVQAAEARMQQTRSQLSHDEQALALHQQAVEALQRDLQRLRRDREQWELREQQDSAAIETTRQQLAVASESKALDQQLVDAIQRVEQAHQRLNTMQSEGHTRIQSLHHSEQQEREARKTIEQAQSKRQQAELACVGSRTRLQDMAEEIFERLQLEAESLLEEDISDEQAAELLSQLHQVEDQLARFGPVNLLAIDEFQQASEREGFLSEQSQDLESSLQTLEETIRRIDSTMRKRFLEVFEQTNAYFMKTFPRLFGGGKAELRLDSDDPLTAGVEVIAQPPGKRLQDVSLLSGGEKALTAVALVFSIFRIKPAPFCILDEVDAPLDDANVERFVDMISDLANEVQFLAITHNKITMQRADRLIGVSMPEAGVSGIVGVDIEAMTKK